MLSDASPWAAPRGPTPRPAAPAGALSRPRLSVNDIPAPEFESIDALFARARRRERPAVEALCLRMRPRLFQIALGVLHDADEADDVAQDALIAALNKRALFLGRGKAANWMSRIALNLAKNRRRDRVRRAALLAEATPEKTERFSASSPPDADQSLQQRAVRARVLAALDRLPPRQRDVARLRLFAELSFAEIAQVLRMREATARVSASQAMRKLRAALADMGRPESAKDPSQKGGPP